MKNFTVCIFFFISDVNRKLSQQHNNVKQTWKNYTER